MPARKAAKKTSKKAAKKHTKKYAGHHPMGHDLRRAYEHLGRLEVLQGGLPPASISQINDLTELARGSLQSGDTHSAANLLRASEHLAFAALAASGKESGIGDDLQDAIDIEYEHLIERAAHHWDEHEAEPTGAMAEIYEKAFAAAEVAYNKGAFRRALEFARAAEALSHVELFPAALTVGTRPRLKR